MDKAIVDTDGERDRCSDGRCVSQILEGWVIDLRRKLKCLQRHLPLWLAHLVGEQSSTMSFVHAMLR